jgi:hypothetical protein
MRFSVGFVAETEFVKQSQSAGLCPEIRSSKLDNSGAVAGCLLPGVVPEIRNEWKLQNKANLRHLAQETCGKTSLPTAGSGAIMG